MDVSLSSSVSSFTMCFVNVWMSLAVVALVTPAFVLGIIPLAVIYWFASPTMPATCPRGRPSPRPLSGR